MLPINSILETIPSYKFMTMTSVNVALGLVFLTAIVYYFYVLRVRKQIQKYKSQVEINKLIEGFHPEPLCVYEDEEDTVNVVLSHGEIVKDSHCILNGKVDIRLDIMGKSCLNFASSNFLNMLNNPDTEANSIAIIKKYGVGSCGPRGFYGTVDVHLDLETRIANFMNMEEAIVYSYGFSTVASSIPAYCKPHDVIFCDIKISNAAKNGIIAARSKCIYFDHNNFEDLEEKAKTYFNSKKKVNPRERRFLILEGLYGKTGNICDLKNMVKIRKNYQMRLFLDESNSIGILGKTGRGIMEHYNVDHSEVDLVIGSLETLIGSVGGFCVGSLFTIEHQRLSGLGYCFSASLPPVLTHAAISGFDYLDENKPTIFENIRLRSEQVHKTLKELKYMRVFGDKQSPIKYLEFSSNDFNLHRKHYDVLLEECRKNGVLLNLCNYSVSDDTAVACSVKLFVNIALTTEDIVFLYDVLSSVSSKIVEN